MAKDFPPFDSAERRALLDALGLDLKQLDRRTRAAIEALSEEVLALRDESAALKAALVHDTQEPVREAARSAMRRRPDSLNSALIP